MASQLCIATEYVPTSSHYSIFLFQTIQLGAVKEVLPNTVGIKKSLRTVVVVRL